MWCIPTLDTVASGPDKNTVPRCVAQKYSLLRSMISTSLSVLISSSGHRLSNLDVSFYLNDTVGRVQASSVYSVYVSVYNKERYSGMYSERTVSW